MLCLFIGMHDLLPCSGMQSNEESISFEPSIAQTVAGVGSIQFKYMSQNRSGNTTVTLIPSFTVQEVCTVSLSEQ